LLVAIHSKKHLSGPYRNEVYVVNNRIIQKSSCTVHTDINEVILALKREDLAISDGKRTIALPPWIDWLVWLGQWMRIQSTLEGRRVAVVRLPNRRLSAAFTALGSAFASARLYNDSLDWEGLKDLAPGSKVFWREYASGKPMRWSGSVVGVRQIAGADFLEVVMEGKRKAHQGNRLFAKSAALSHGITLGSVSAISDARLTGAERVFEAALKDTPKGWPRSPNIECTVITERTSFLGDLESLAIRVADTVQADCSDILTIADAGGRTHGKTRVTPPRNNGVLDESGGWLTILDGAAAMRRMSETTARSVVILLDQAEYDEDVEQLLQSYLDYAADTGIHLPSGGVMPPPEGVQPFIFGLQLQGWLNT
jgi:hypothetical protein